MKKKIKIIGLIIGIIWLFGGAFVLKHYAFQDAPITQNMTLEQIQQLPIKMAYVETEEGWNEASYASFCKKQLAGAEKSDCIMKVTPTGNLYINRGLILQEVSVKNVIKGECRYDTIWIKNGLRNGLVYRGKDVLLAGKDTSFMQEGCEYLVFIEPAATNQYSEKKVYEEFEEMWFGCYNLTKDSNTIVDANEPEYDPDIEFYTSNEKLIECYNEAKKELVKKYCVEK